MKTRTFATIFGALLAAGCGNSANQQACASLADAECERLDQCSAGSLTQRLYGDINTCVARATQDCLASLAASGASTTPALVEACATSLQTTTCTDFFLNNQPSACDGVGSLADGAACAFDLQCKGGNCAVASGSLCGTCAAAQAAGEPCTIFPCGSGLACAQDSMRCVVPATDGTACGRALPCGPGLSCVGATKTTMGLCHPAGATLGAACDSSAATLPICDDNQGFYCNGTAGQCGYVTFASDGAGCGLQDDDSFIACSDSGLCVIAPGARTGTCSATAADGAACDLAAGPPCLPLALCIPTNGGTAGTCQLPNASACH